MKCSTSKNKMLKKILSSRKVYYLIQRDLRVGSYNRTSYKESFQYRILDYFANVLQTYRNSQQYGISFQIREELPVKEKFESIYAHILNIPKKEPKQKLENLLQDFDIKCISIIDSLIPSEILILLTVYLKIFPHELITSHFYHEALKILTQATENGLLSNHEIVELLFFISLRNEKGAEYVHFLKPFLPALDSLTLIEKCIVAQSFFKSSLKLQQDQLKVLEKVLQEECKSLIDDPLLLVSVCKAVRISKPSSELNLNPLSKAIIHLDKPFNFMTAIHILSLYAQALSFEKEAVDKIVEDSIEIIKQDNIKNSIRLKDLDRFLWSISYLGLDLTSQKKDVLRLYLEQRYEELKIQKNLGYFVNSILCLHMLQSGNTEQLIKTCFKEQVFLPIYSKVYHWKVRSRLQLLMTQIFLEMRITIPPALRRHIDIKYTPSKNVDSVAQITKKLCDQSIIKNTLVECPIKTLQIPGVTLITEKRKYHIDVLDDSTCLKNTNVPYGLMKLKSRLLQKMKYEQILILGATLENNIDEVQSEIEQKIKRK